MATCTIIVTSNSDGTLKATSTSNAICPSDASMTSLKALMQWIKGTIHATLVQGSVNVIGSD